MKNIFISLLAVCVFVGCSAPCEKEKSQEAATPGCEKAKFLEGAIPSCFSVSPTKTVSFSQGNLQYQASTGTWRFAENQYDIIGEDNCNISSTYSGWIDLFGWGTSGYNSKHPYMTGQTSADYGNGKADISGTNYDWGVYNAISNGGKRAGLWRTLTADEWEYLFETRSASTINGTADARFALVLVSNRLGVILFPDNFVWPNESIAQPAGVNVLYGSWGNSSYTVSEFQQLQAAGCVFLPVAGFREGARVYGVASGGGDYWSSSHDGGGHAYKMSLSTGYVFSQVSDDRHNGYSVRLVQDNN